MVPLLELRDVTVDFANRSGWLGRLIQSDRDRRAVDGVSLQINRGESIGVVGESGSGKTTLARAIIGLTQPTAGQLFLDGEPLPAKRSRSSYRRVQMVFQDPTSSLNPTMTIGRTLIEPMRAQRRGADTSELNERARELLKLVELPESLMHVRPRRLSGGQRQRVAIARALAVDPEILIADEAVSALDVSVQAAIINLLRRLQRELGLTLLFITHNLAVVRQIADRTAVMYMGRIVEEGSTGAMLSSPQHPYTRLLLDAAPRMQGGRRPAAPPTPNGVDSRLTPPHACAFFDRCSIADQEQCHQVLPPIHDVAGRRIACHFPHHAWSDTLHDVYQSTQTR